MVSRTNTAISPSFASNAMKKKSKSAAPLEQDVEPSPPIDPESLDPLDPRKVSLDLFELYCYEMIMTGDMSRRVFLIKKMRYMINRLIGKQYDFGRLYNYSNLANMVGRICGRHAYHNQKQEDEYQLQDHLIDFSHEKWEKVIKQFEASRNNLIRRDAAVTVLPIEIEEISGADEEDEDLIPSSNDEINPELESSGVFNESFSQMKDWIKFHACLSYIQPQFDNAIQNGTDVMPRKSINNFNQAVKKHFAGDKESEFATILLSLFGTSSRKPKRELSLKPIRELKSIHEKHSRLFDLNRLQNKLLKLTRQWTEITLPVPNLAKVGYGSTTTVRQVQDKEDVTSDKENVELEMTNDSLSESASSSESQVKIGQSARKKRKSENATKSSKRYNHGDAGLFDPDQGKCVGAGSKVNALARKRDSFGKKVTDPLEESVALAASLSAREALVSPKKNKVSTSGSNEVMHKFYQKKSSAYQMKFDDSESSDDEEDGHNLVMSKVPDRLEETKDSELAVLPNQTAVQHSGPKKRKRFTAEEDDAIMKGVRMCGAGKWSEIKSQFPIILKDRTAIQIKDRFRTLNKSDE